MEEWTKVEISKIEKKWQKVWKENQTFLTDLSEINKPKKYVLAAFPYPSGSGLHVGHLRNYTLADAMARFYRMQGFNVLFPIGWDAFGLPAEQYAIQTGNHPATFTQKNIQKFKRQLKKMGFSYDWSKEINTSQPSYYRWTQWIFSQIYHQGLAEYQKIPVYWCQELGTVLANEEIELINGKKVSQRGSFPVSEKSIPQWLLKITDYAPELLAGLAKLDWPASIKTSQANWIGLSQGVLIDFFLVDKSEKISVFTTRSDTIYGVNALALSPSHPLVERITIVNQQKSVKEFCRYWKNRAKKKELAGVFTGSYCLNPINKEKIPVWITNYVLADYGTGALMVSPTCHLIDWQFAKKYHLPIKLIVKPNFSNSPPPYPEEITAGHYSYLNSPLLEGIKEQKQAQEIINHYLIQENQGQIHHIYHLKDWVFSRQRYWGEPIPCFHWENGTKEILPAKDLPLKLPLLTDFTPNPLYYSPLEKISEWVKIEKSSGLKGKRDVNVMPQWAGSCWYYLAFLLKKKNHYLALNGSRAREIFNYWLPVDLYLAGPEHANSHYLYARFWHKVLAKIGIVDLAEPFQKLFCQGMILGKDGEKMSKSRGNVVNPDSLVAKYGADALRLAVLFLAPPEQTTSFKLETVQAMKKWLKRVYWLFTCSTVKLTEFPDQQWEAFYPEILEKITKYYQSLKLNLVIPQLMVFVNQSYQKKTLPFSYALSFLQWLNPLAPHLTEEIWSRLNTDFSLAYQPWPKKPTIKLNSHLKTTNLVVQINGKKRAILPLLTKKKKAEIEKEVSRNPQVHRWLENQKIIKVIYLEDKLINFVVSAKQK